ncbi:fibronectin type III domain-containing protein [Candidatus Daviesbacteria bacterium]|nr:fibronectin type III domain-containing protein [Candidatus Daviesbacteria bacterium]
MSVLPKKILLVILLVLVIGFLLYYILKLIEPSSSPQNVLISNVTDHQATVTWTTQKPTKGALLVSDNGKFPILPIFTKIFRDDGEKLLGKMNFYPTHKVTVDNLDPNKTYQFRIYQGWKKKYQGSFTTGPVLQSINTPNPVYGRVLSSDKKPIVGALVYLQVINEASQSAKATRSSLLSTLTNKEGRWSMDLANLRSFDLTDTYPVGNNTTEEIIVDTGRSRVKAQTTTKQDNPWPDIILK